jgi:hypothetical protein
MAEQKPDEAMILRHRKYVISSSLVARDIIVPTECLSGDDLKGCQEVSQINTSARRPPSIQGDLGLEQQEETTVRRNQVLMS